MLTKFGVTTMFERFTGDARHAVVHAQEEARRLGHGRIGTVHLLLGLLHQEGGPSSAPAAPAARALGEHGATAEALRAAAEAGAAPAPERRFRPGRLLGAHVPFSKRAKKAMELSLREAVRLDHRSIAGPHVLLGVLRTEGGAHRALERTGVDAEALRRTAERLACASDRPR